MTFPTSTCIRSAEARCRQGRQCQRRPLLRPAGLDADPPSPASRLGRSGPHRSCRRPPGRGAGGFARSGSGCARPWATACADRGGARAGPEGPPSRQPDLSVRAYDRRQSVPARPLRGRPVGGHVEDRGDAERYIDRAIFAPATRSYTAEAWVSAAVERPDSARSPRGEARAPRFDSSSRCRATPVSASSALDGRADSAVDRSGCGLTHQLPGSPGPLHDRSPSPGGWPRRRSMSVGRAWCDCHGAAARRLHCPSQLTGPSCLEGGTRPELPTDHLAARFPAGSTPRERKARAVGARPCWCPASDRSQFPAAVRCARRAAACESAPGSVIPLRPEGTIAQLDAGQPLRARSCASAARMPGGLQVIRSLPDRSTSTCCDFTLRPPSRSRRERAAAASSTRGASGAARSPACGVALMDRPGSSSARASTAAGGRRATAGRSEHRECAERARQRMARIRRLPQGRLLVRPPRRARGCPYWISAAICLVLAVFLLVGGGCAAGRLAAPSPPTPAEAPPRRMPLPRAAGIAFIATIPLSLWFALRTGVVIFPVLTFILWRGVGPRALIGAAAALLAALPIVYADHLAARSRRLQLQLQRRLDLGPLDRRGGDRPARGRGVENPQPSQAAAQDGASASRR